MTTASDRRRALMALWATPVLFSVNMVIGRAVIADVGPFTLAFLRWTLAGAILVAIAARGLAAHRAALVAEARWIALLALLGMGICGAGVYWALEHTTATNGTLIYATAPVFIVLLDWIWRGIRATPQAVAGVALGLAGVVAIVAQGSLDRLLGLAFNVGDLGFGLATVAWSIYSVVLKRPGLQALPTLPLFAAIACAGALVNAPGAMVEIVATGRFPTAASTWAAIVAVAVFASVAAFSCFQYGVRIVGPSVAGMFMYLSPPAGVAMATVFLGERLHPHHLAGLVLILAGVALSTGQGARLVDHVRRHAA